MGKKGQLKIQQTAFMIVAVTILFVLVGMFVLVIQLSNLRNDADRLNAQNARLLAAKLANSPEFACGDSYPGLTDCIDLDKVMILKSNIQKYKDFWGVQNIEVRTIYPLGKIICDSKTYPNCNIIKLLDGEMSGTYSTFVVLCRKESKDEGYYDKCELGKIIVSYNENNGK